MEIKQRAKLAIERGEQWKNATLAGLMPEFDAAEIENIQAIDPTRGLVALGHAEAVALLQAADKDDDVANALRAGVAKSAGVDRVYWQACDVLRVAKQHSETAADDCTRPNVLLRIEQRRPRVPLCVDTWRGMAGAIAGPEMGT